MNPCEQLVKWSVDVYELHEYGVERTYPVLVETKVFEKATEAMDFCDNVNDGLQDSTEASRMATCPRAIFV